MCVRTQPTISDEEDLEPGSSTQATDFGAGNAFTKQELTVWEITGAYGAYSRGYYRSLQSPGNGFRSSTWGAYSLGDHGIRWELTVWETMGACVLRATDFGVDSALIQREPTVWKTRGNS